MIDGGWYGDLDLKWVVGIFYFVGYEWVFFRDVGFGVVDDGLGYVEGGGVIYGLVFVVYCGVVCDFELDFVVWVDCDFDYVVVL